MKLLVKFIAVILVIVFLVWGIPMIKCEYLTARYGYEFDLEESYKQNSLIPKTQSFKVMSYSNEQAELYCIGENYSAGNVLHFKKADGKWVYDRWKECVWSAIGGNADNDIWPYFWHNTKYARISRAEISPDESSFVRFWAEGEKAYIECDLTIESRMDYYASIEGCFSSDEGTFLKDGIIYAHDKETGSDKFKLVRGTNKITVVFVGDFGGTYQKANKSLPGIEIYPYTDDDN